MSSLEDNWEVGVLVTAEATYGIGFSPYTELPDAAENIEAANEAAD